MRYRPSMAGKQRNNLHRFSMIRSMYVHNILRLTYLAVAQHTNPNIHINLIIHRTYCYHCTYIKHTALSWHCADFGRSRNQNRGQARFSAKNVYVGEMWKILAMKKNYVDQTNLKNKAPMKKNYVDQTNLKNNVRQMWRKNVCLRVIKKILDMKKMM